MNGGLNWPIFTFLDPDYTKKSGGFFKFINCSKFRDLTQFYFINSQTTGMHFDLLSIKQIKVYDI